MNEPRESILVVDDQPTNVKLVAFLLTTQGFIVRTAPDAQSALDAILEELPAVILMDLQMPGMDGFSLTRRLRTDPRTERVFIVAFTAYAMRGDETKAFEAGCDAYLTKPIDTRSLPEAMRSYLTAARVKRESQP